MSLTTYPISLPATPGIVTNTIRKLTVVASTASPFSLSQQSQTWPGQMWLTDLELPKMIRANGAAWAAAFASLNGKEGSLLIGDTANKLPRGNGQATALISTTPAINNGGFETAGAGGADVFANWTEFTSGTSAIARDTTVFSAGSASCRFDVDGSGSGVSVGQTVLTVGRKYAVTFRAKVSGASTQQLRIDGTVSTIQAFDLTTSWSDYSASFTAADTGLYFVRHSGATGLSIWIDSVLVVPLDTYGGLVDGASQTGYVLNTKGWLASQTGILLAGDWLQLGTGYNSRLYQVVFDANSDSSGNASLTIWPQLRSSPADGDAVKVTTAQGRFMLAKEPEYSIGPDHFYTFSTISLVEDLRP